MAATLTRRDYRIIAGALKQVLDSGEVPFHQVVIVAETFANALAGAYANFNRTTFLRFIFS